MATNVFQDMIKKASSGMMPVDPDEAKVWYRQRAQEVRNVQTNQVIRKSQAQMKNTVLVGHMYLFLYDPKLKDDLPYYDRFPLIFPFRKVQGGFYGINMHYLPHLLRAKLMDALYHTINNDKMDDTTRLRITYNILNSSAKFRYFKPCVKHYLNNHVKSRFVHVDPKEWDLALFLPLERFAKANKNKVFAESKKKIYQ